MSYNAKTASDFIALNCCPTASHAVPMTPIFTFLAALPNSSRPFPAPLKSNDFLSFSVVSIDFCAFFSKSELLNDISTTLFSIVVLILRSPLSKYQKPCFQKLASMQGLYSQHPQHIHQFQCHDHTVKSLQYSRRRLHYHLKIQA